MPRKKYRSGRLRPSEEKHQPEKKLPIEGEGSQPKQQQVIVEDWDDDDFSPNERGDDFMSRQKIVETGFGRDYDIFASVRNQAERRNCDKVHRCHKFRHKSKFDGLPVFELFKVKLILNKDCLRHLAPVGTVSGRLYGIIETNASEENPDRISYFSVKKENALPITLDITGNDPPSVNLPLSCPRTKPHTASYQWKEVYFALKFEFDDGESIDLFSFGACHDDMVNVEVFGEDGLAKWSVIAFAPYNFHLDRMDMCHITRRLFASDTFRVAAYYGIYDGVWAYVDVKILKKGVRKFYGFIFARPCIFYSRIRMLSIQSNQMCELPSSGSIDLARPVVAIPSFSSLVIAAKLYDQDGNVIVRDKTFFQASPEGTVSGQIGKGHVHIEVKWECKHVLNRGYYSKRSCPH